MFEANNSFLTSGKNTSFSMNQVEKMIDEPSRKDDRWSSSLITYVINQKAQSGKGKISWCFARWKSVFERSY